MAGRTIYSSKNVDSQFSRKLVVSIRHFLEIYFAPWTSEKLLFFCKKTVHNCWFPNSIKEEWKFDANKRDLKRKPVEANHFRKTCSGRPFYKWKLFHLVKVTHFTKSHSFYWKPPCLVEVKSLVETNYFSWNHLFLWRSFLLMEAFALNGSYFS